jgi:hypothetical protein
MKELDNGRNKLVEELWWLDWQIVAKACFYLVSAFPTGYV